MEPGFYLVELGTQIHLVRERNANVKTKTHSCPFWQRDSPTDGSLFHIPNHRAFIDVCLRDLDSPPANFQPCGDRVVGDIHIFFLHAGNVKLGGDLSCENAGLKSGLDKRVDCCDSHPRAICGILEFHTTQKVVVSFHPHTDGRRGLTSIAASSEEVLVRVLARPAAWMVPRASL